MSFGSRFLTSTVTNLGAAFGASIVTISIDFVVSMAAHFHSMSL